MWTSATSTTRPTRTATKVPRGIICGAPNMAAGEKVVVTLPGAVLPGDFKIEPRKTYGHVSDGMCASERELGLGDNHDGIILLREYGFTPGGIQGAQARRRRDAPAAPRPADPGDQHHPGPRLCVLVPRRGPRIPPLHRRRRSSIRVTELNERAGPPLPRWSPASPATSRSSSTTTTRFTACTGCDRYVARAIARASTRRITRRTGCAAALIRAGMRSISLRRGYARTT